MVRFAAVVLVLAACHGTRAAAIPLEIYRPAEGTTIALAVSGKTAIVRGPSPVTADFRPDDLRFVERTSARVLARVTGRPIGLPGDREAYALVEERVVAMVGRREVALELPPLGPMRHWRLVASTVDHQAGRALLAFDEDVDPEGALEQADADRDRGASRLELVEVDTMGMAVRGRATVSLLGSRMAADDLSRAIVDVETLSGTRQRTYGSAPRARWFATNGAELYVIARVPERAGLEVEHWVATRYDGHTWTWSTPFEAPPGIGDGAVLAAVTGDGKTLVIAHGARSYGLLDAKTSVLVDTATGAARSVARRPSDLGKISALVAVPNAPRVAQLHRYEPAAHSGGDSSFHGISVLDASTGEAQTILDTTQTHRELRHDIPATFSIAPNGTYLLGM